MSDAPVSMNETSRRRRVPNRNVDPETGERLTAPEKVLPPTLAPMEEAPAEPAPTGPTQEERDSAFDVINDLLTMYGLESLTDFVSNFIVEYDQINTNIIWAEVQKTEEYRTRFAGNIERQEAGLNVLSPEEYIGLEKTYADYMRAAGMPVGFYDSPDDFSALIGGNVSPAEVYRRVEEGYAAVRDADPEVIRQMKELYGVTEGGLAAFFLDPEKARDVVLQQARTAEVAAGAVLGGGSLNLAEAEMLAREGITLEQTRTGVGMLEDLGELFTPLTGETDQGFTRQEQLGAVFGTDPRAAQRLRQQQRRRQAAFETGGRFAGQGAEITGLR